MAESGGGEITVPPTIQALLAARLDQLDAPERDVLERGSVEGRVFHRGAVQALAPEESQVMARLTSLVRKELVRPDKSELPGEDAFRFRHLLVRDAAYDALPKATRAELHERFAGWLVENGRDLVELDEILGYHLEQACRYQAELGAPVDDSVAGDARQRLTAAGRRAMVRHDFPAAVNLLQRAGALLPPDEIDSPLVADLVGAFFQAGRMEEAFGYATDVIARAAAAGDRAAELCARIEQATFRTYLAPEGATDQLAATIEEALPVFEASGDEFGLFTAYLGLTQVAHMHARMDTELQALEQALAHARRLADLPLTERLTGFGSASRLHGSTPVPEVLAWLDEQEEHMGHRPNLRMHRAQALAMLARFAEGRAMLTDLRAQLADQGSTVPLALATGFVCVEVELLAGDPAAAAAFAEEGCRLLEEAGDRAWLSSVVGKLALALYELNRLDEADAAAGRSAELGASDDVLTQMLWRQARAKVLARRGDPVEAEQLAREAVALGEDVEMPDTLAHAYLDLGEVLILGAGTDEARAAFEQALTLYERKGNLAMAERTTTRLRELAPSA